MAAYTAPIAVAPSTALARGKRSRAHSESGRTPTLGRVSLKISESGSNDPQHNIGAAENLLIEQFMLRGFAVSAPLPERVQFGAQSPSAAEPVSDAKAVTAQDFAPDVALVGDVNHSRRGASVRLRAIYPRTALVMARAEVFRPTLAMAAQAAAEQMSKELISLWRGTRSVLLIVRGVDKLRHGKQLEAKLTHRIAGVLEAEIDGYRDRTLLLELRTQLDSARLADLLVDRQFDGFALETEEAGRFVVVMRVSEPEVEAEAPPADIKAPVEP